MTSAAWPVQVALVAALNADAGLVARLAGAQRVFSGKAPANTAGRYIVVGDTAEARLAAFGADAKRGAVLLHLWSDKVNNQSVLEVYADVERILDGVALPLVGHRMVTGAVELLTMFPDEDLARIHGVARYTPVTFREA